MRHVIIGAGAAGITAAQTIRKHSPSDEIIMISTDKTVVSRCMLHKLIGGERSELSFVPQDFFKKYNIIWHNGATVTEVDQANKTVKFDGQTESFDKLLIATGARSTFPPIPGLKDAKNVYGLRDLSDAETIREKAGSAKNIVIMGAGLVGLDAAYGLTQMGKRPTVIDMAGYVLSANLDQRAASRYQAEFEIAGCQFKFNSKVGEVITDGSGNVSGLKVNGNEDMPCDLLIVAAGVAPENALIPQQVDKYLNAGNSEIYAAGDAAGLSASWPNATEQGEVAALNMCGIKTEYHGNALLQNTVNFFGIKSLSLGEFNPRDNDECEIREDKAKYQKIVLRGGVPVGVILQGDIARSGFWQHMIKNKTNVSDISKPVWKLSFADGYGLNENAEYEWSK